MKSMLKMFVVLVVAGFMAGGNAAHAATVYFFDQSAWNAAVSGVTTETYESYGWNSGSGNGLGNNATLGDIDYSFSGEIIFGCNSTALTYDAAYLSGSYLEWQSSPGFMTVTLPNAVTAIGFRYGEFYGSGNLNLSVLLGNGDSTSVSTLPASYAFFGAVSDTAFSSFKLNADRNYIIIDDLSRANGATAVPEPSTLVLVGSALAGLSWTRKRSRN